MVMFLVIFFSSFHMFPENWPFLSAFVVHLDIRGGSGGPPGASSGAFRGPGRHQIVDISLVLNA